LSLDSFSSKEGSPPGKSSFFATGIIILVFLAFVEKALAVLLENNQHQHPILQNETNRLILARHVGVDTLSCTIVAILGVYTLDAVDLWKRDKTLHHAAYDQRLFTYHPAGYRIALFFFWYQIKNLYDTIIWKDGPEFIFHHVFSLITAWGALYPCSANVYAIFFMGLSEISTAVLCLLANFDDEHGVPGLGDAMPMAKVALGAAFVILFVLCRCILWPIYSYYFVRDIRTALKVGCARTRQRRRWLYFFMISLTGLSILQVAWLGQIFVIAKEELVKTGLL